MVENFIKKKSKMIEAKIKDASFNTLVKRETLGWQFFKTVVTNFLGNTWLRNSN